MRQSARRTRSLFIRYAVVEAIALASLGGCSSPSRM
jgi:hypothetical protein